MSEWLTTPVHFGHHSLVVLDVFEVLFVTLAARLALGLMKRALRRAESFSRLDEGKRFIIYRMVSTGVWALALVSSLSILGMNLTALWAGSAALLVGVGIGLQGFFNDVVSGFVLLFEGGVAVGNVLEVEGQLVRVDRIDLRSTRGVSMDGELIVLPNSKVSGEAVTNLSQGEGALRIHVDVGVAYGSPLELVERLLMDAVQEQPEVETDPSPMVFFQDFGDSSLNFTVVAWIRDPWLRMEVSSGIRKAIDARFREHGVEIPFPQRDIHLRNAN